MRSHHNAIKVVFYFHHIFGGRVAHLHPSSLTFVSHLFSRSSVTSSPFPARVKVGGCKRGIGGPGGLGPRCSGRRAEVEARGGARTSAAGGEGARQQHVRRGKRVSPCRSTVPRLWRQAPTLRLRCSFRPRWSARRTCPVPCFRSFLVLVVAVEAKKKRREQLCFVDLYCNNKNSAQRLFHAVPRSLLTYW